MTVVPVAFEATDEGGELLFKVEAFDECCATVTISSAITLKSWEVIAPAIQSCLDSMALRD